MHRGSLRDWAVWSQADVTGEEFSEDPVLEIKNTRGFFLMWIQKMKEQRAFFSSRKGLSPTSQSMLTHPVMSPGQRCWGGSSLLSTQAVPASCTLQSSWKPTLKHQDIFKLLQNPRFNIPLNFNGLAHL